MKTLKKTNLLNTNGGMEWSCSNQSSNVEDRRSYWTQLVDWWNGCGETCSDHR